ncbi:MAG: LytR family transcriptional regulator [Armatimonadetes bacterium]|nr:MAG: LytR family transcriptional regulator [Armatimonadota bacterium]
MTSRSESTPVWHRIFTVANGIFAASTIAAFVLLMTIADTHALVVAAALSATAIGLSVWWFSIVRTGSPDRPKPGPVAIRAVAGAVILLVGYGAFTGAQLWGSWNSIDRETFALADARAALQPVGVTTTTTIPIAAPIANGPTTTTPTLPDEPFVTMLLIGGDANSGNGDVILYLVLPTNGAEPFMMSFPRDLYVSNPCTGGNTRINTLSKGCPGKDINGGTLLSVQVSDMTGIDVDHFAVFDFDGFIDIIDAVGGIEICLDHAVRDPGAELDLPEGCTNANGEQALSWVRSRHTEEFRDGGWRSVPGRGDLLRNEHQQELILQLAKKLKSFSSPRQLTEIVAAIADTFILSNTLSLGDAINLAWSTRDIDIDDINRLQIPVRLSRSPSNQSILKETMSPKDVIAAQYGDDLPTENS